MEKTQTHTYPTIPSDDQPDRSAAHKNLARTYRYNGRYAFTKNAEITPTCDFRIATVTDNMVERPIHSR